MPMEKLTAGHPETQSADVVAENIARLKALFPELVTEGKDGAAVNVDVLKQLVGDATVTDCDEKFGLNWHGKRRARQLALTPSTGTLRPCPEESVDWDTTQNLFIEGDNLEVLKLLQRSYAGEVKAIYIDPPYNTGNDFVYPDDYTDSIRNYLIRSGQIESDGRKNTSNTVESGRYHTDWLNMMLPRIKLAKSLLCESGVFVVSISDAEVAQLRAMCDDVFGEENLVGIVEWNSTKSVTNTALISVGHTHNLVYARSLEYFTAHRSHFRLPESGDGFANPDKDPRGPWKADPFQVGGWRPNQQYEIVNPNTGEKYKPNEGCSWKNDHAKFKELIADNRIVFGVSGEAGPQRKRFLSEATERGRVAKTWWDDVGTTTNGTQLVKSLFDGLSVFTNPKPLDLIQRFIELGDHTRAGIILDFFAGSGTTGHAVLAQNAADSGCRKYILVQLPEPLDPNVPEQQIAADFCERLRVPKNIAELTKERMRRAAKQVRENRREFLGDLGFRVFKLDSSNIREWEPRREDIAESLAEHVENLRADRTEQDILYELLLKRGLDLCVPIETREIAGKAVHSIGAGSLFACLAESITRDEGEELALGIVAWHKDLDPAGDTAVIFRDAAFADDVVKTNVAAILEQNGLKNVRSL